MNKEITKIQEENDVFVRQISKLQEKNKIEKEQSGPVKKLTPQRNTSNK